MSDISELKRLLAAQAQAVAEHLLPAGKREGQEWRVGSIAGEPGHSLGVHLAGQKAGVWRDFGTEDGGDLIDLWVAARRVTLTAALGEIRAWLGIDRPRPHWLQARTWRQPARPKCQAPRGRAMDYLREDRNLSAEAIAIYKIGEDERGNIVFPFLRPDGSLAMIKRRAPEEGAKPVPTEAECEPILFGWQAVPDDAREVVICEGEIDALSWYDYGRPALSVPYGGGGGAKQKWIESEYDQLDRFERIHLALDMDGPGEEGALEIANRLGRHRCLRVKMPRKDANACLVDGVSRVDMDAALASAAWFDVAGLRLPAGFVDKVTRLLWPREGDRVGYRTPYGKLGNRLLFRPGELTIWTGDSGAGKTQILNDCVVDWIAQGGRTCLSSLEMHPAFTLTRMCRQIVGSERPTEEAIDAALHWADEGLLIYELMGKQKLEDMLAMFDYARARHGCDLFVIDSLMRLGVASDDYNSQEAVIFRIVDWAMANAVHVHLVAHARKGERERGAPTIEDIKGAMELGANAFNIVSVWRDRRHEDAVAALANKDPAEAAKLAQEKPGVVLNVRKQRNGDFEGKIGLWFDQRTYRYRSSVDPATWQRDFLSAAGRRGAA